MFAAVILAVVATIILIPLALQLVDIPKDIRVNYVMLQSVATTLALTLGGIWALFQFVLFRNLHPHLSLSQEVTHRLINPDYFHIGVSLQVHNTSRVKVVMGDVLFQLQEVAPTTKEEAERLRDEVFMTREKNDLQWPLRYELSRGWRQGMVSVAEPRESLEIACEFIVPSTMHTVLVYSFVDNSQYKEKPQRVEGWARSTVHDLTAP